LAYIDIFIIQSEFNQNFIEPTEKLIMT